MRKITKYVLSVAAFTAFGMPVPTTAQSCDTFLGNINNWLFANKPNGQILLRQAGIRADGLANYVEGPQGTVGTLTYHPPFLFLPAYVQGDIVQYFNTRRYDPTNTGKFAWAPFDPFWVDSVGITIYLGNSPAPPLGSGTKLGQVTFTLHAFGNVQFSMQGLCQGAGSHNPNGMLYGLMYGFLGDSVQGMSLEEFIVPPPPR